MAEQSLKEKTAKGLFWGGLSNGIQQILNLLFGLILARILSAEDYGMVGMLAIFSAIASTIQESGFTAALTNQKEIRNEDYNAVFWFSSLVGVLFYLVLFFCAPLIAEFYDQPELIGLSRVVFLGFLFGGIGIAPSAYLFKTLMVKEKAKTEIISLICSGIVGVILALKGFAYYGLAIQSAVYMGVGSLLRFYYSPWKPSLSIDWRPLKDMFGFSSKLILTNIVTQISNNIFSVVLGKLYNPRQLGFYSQGYKWMGMGFQLIGSMISGVAQPVFVNVVDDTVRQKQVFRKMVRFGAFVSYPTILGLAFIGKEFIWILLGEKWLSSVPFLQLTCLWGCVRFLWLIYTNLLISQGKSDVYLKGIIYFSIIQLIVIIGLSPLGIYPMIVGYIITYYMAIFMWHFFVRKIFQISIIEVVLDMMPYLGAISLSFITAFLAVRDIENLYVSLLLKILISAFIYIIILYVGKSKIFEETAYYLSMRTKK